MSASESLFCCRSVPALRGTPLSQPHLLLPALVSPPCPPAPPLVTPSGCQRLPSTPPTPPCSHGRPLPPAGPALQALTFSFFLFFLFVFLGVHLWHMKAPRLGAESELQPPTYSTATVKLDPSCIFNYTTAHGNTGALTHCARPGIEPPFSWILVGFVTPEPRRDL